MLIALSLMLLLYSGVAGSITAMYGNVWIAMLYLPASVLALWGMSQDHMLAISAAFIILAHGLNWYLKKYAYHDDQPSTQY